MQTFEIEALRQKWAEEGRPYLEFLRRPSMSMGLYTLPAGAYDPQDPHEQDEVYYVLQGRATLEVESVEQPVQSGSVVYVPAHAVHRFHTIEEELTVLVFFAPAET